MGKNKRNANLWLFLFAADFAAIVVSYYTTVLLRFHSAWGERFFTSVNRFLGVRETGALPELFEHFYHASALRIIVFLALVLCVLYGLRDLYSGRRFIRARAIGWNITVANVIAMAIFYAYFYLSRNVFHPRSVFATVLGLNVIFCVLFRHLVDVCLSLLRSRHGYDLCPTVLAGSSPEAEFVSVLIDETHPHGVSIIEHVPSASPGRFAEWVGELESICRRCGARMLISVDSNLSVEQLMLILKTAESLDLPVKILSDKLDVLVTRARLPVDMVRHMPLLHFPAPSEAGAFRNVRLAVARVCAGIALLAGAPLMAAIALLIKATSRGPVFFIQTRIGVNRVPFRMFKFRTMYALADEVQAQVEEFNESGGGLFKIRKDPRVTLIGRFLRRFSLDELPQLINVVRAEMTLVGPRPLPRRDFENYYEEWHYSRHSGLPGLTCLWQTSGRSDLGFQDMCVLDVFYLRNQNWMLDLKIVLRTLLVVLSAKGAY